MISTAILIVLALAFAPPASAQSFRLGPFGFRGFIDAGSQAFSASDSFDAVLGENRGTFIGGGGQVTWKQFVIEVSGSRFKQTGERVFVFGGEVFKLGIPTTITLTPIEVSGLYRLPPLFKRVTPYAGGGFGTQKYKESSQFADDSENIDTSHTSYHVAGGAEVGFWKWIGAAAEVRYRTVPDAIGEAGVSKEFNEKDLGGTSVRVKIIVGL